METIISMFPSESTTKLFNTKYLDIVKEMDYYEFYNVISKLFPDVSRSLICSSKYVKFTSDSSDYSIETYSIINYPIVIIEDNDKTYKFKGYLLEVLNSKIKSLNSHLIYLPIELSTRTGEYHLMVLVINTVFSTAFLYDPNGHKSSYSKEVCNVLQRYIIYINIQTGLHLFFILNNTYDKMNRTLPIIGDGNCLICSIIFMLLFSKGYSLRMIDKLICNKSQKSKQMLKYSHITLLNNIGMYLIKM